jgi:hypothetical protein
MTPDMEKPVLRCIVAYRLADDSYSVRTGEPVTLEHAAHYAKYGWEVIIDPFDQEALARWEQIQRATRQNPRW